MGNILLAAKPHCVYYLVDPSTNELLYIGRSQNPRGRARDHARRFKRPMVLEHFRIFDNLEKAQAYELKAIREESPTLNKKLISSPGHLGHKNSPKVRAGISEHQTRRWSDPVTRLAMSEQLTGRKKTEQHKERIRQSLTGHEVSATTRAKISQANKGRGKGVPKSPEHRAKITAALRRRNG